MMGKETKEVGRAQSISYIILIKIEFFLKDMENV